MVAYAWATTYQQSNRWAIETLASLVEPGAATRERAQAWLQFQGYEPGTLRLDAFARLRARVTRANISFDDHPNTKRFSDPIETVTADSVFDWRPAAGGAMKRRRGLRRQSTLAAGTAFAIRRHFEPTVATVTDRFFRTYHA